MAASLTRTVDESGMILDLTLLDRVLNDEVVRPLAGKHLNDRVRIMEDPALYADCTGLT